LSIGPYLRSTRFLQTHLAETPLRFAALHLRQWFMSLRDTRTA
jgi:hypothetical protein